MIHETPLDKFFNLFEGGFSLSLSNNLIILGDFPIKKDDRTQEVALSAIPNGKSSNMFFNLIKNIKSYFVLCNYIINY